MAKERKASVIYEGNASQLVYAFPFDYLRKKFVKVEDIYTNITELTMGVDYTVEDKQVRLVKGIPLGHSVKIYRETTTAPLVEWQDASVLRSADLSLQEVQLLHLAEETADKVFDSGMSTAYDNPNCWDGQYKRIINALDPIEDGDVVTLRYIKANQDSLLNQLKNTGATQNSSIVATGDSQNARLDATGDTQNKRLTDTGNAYVSTMTTLKDTAATKADDASNSAELSKKWAMSSSSPDGVSGNKSAKIWAEEAKTSAGNSAASASASASSANASASSATNSANSANASKQSASASANSASASASSASDSATSASKAKISETNASNSAKAAKQSEENAKTWDPTQYVQSVTESNGKITVTKGGGDSTLINLIDTFYPIGTVYVSADKSKTKADFPFMQYGTWKEVPANLCLQTGNASEAGTQRSAGLPNITGHAEFGYTNSSTSMPIIFTEGALSSTNSGRKGGFFSGDGGNQNTQLSFNASESNSIYGSSNTVQPPSYLVRAWVRTA
nr:MAG TPA: tail fiber protein [Caudoviricetes sp.]